MLACSRVSDAHANCSTLSGRSGTSDLSALVRRSRNGEVSWRSAAAAATSWLRSIGVAKRRRNWLRLPSRPGVTIDMIDHSSLSRFSTGVPVRAMCCSAGRVRNALAVRVSGFFTAWASSNTTVAHCTAFSVSMSRAATW